MERLPFEIKLGDMIILLKNIWGFEVRPKHRTLNRSGKERQRMPFSIHLAISFPLFP